MTCMELSSRSVSSRSKTRCDVMMDHRTLVAEKISGWVPGSNLLRASHSGGA